MKTIATRAVREDHALRVPSLLTNDQLATVAGGRRPPDYIIPRIPPAVMLDQADAAS